MHYFLWFQHLKWDVSSLKNIKEFMDPWHIQIISCSFLGWCNLVISYWECEIWFDLTEGLSLNASCPVHRLLETCYFNFYGFLQIRSRSFQGIRNSRSKAYFWRVNLRNGHSTAATDLFKPLLARWLSTRQGLCGRYQEWEKMAAQASIFTHPLFIWQMILKTNCVLKTYFFVQPTFAEDLEETITI